VSRVAIFLPLHTTEPTITRELASDSQRIDQGELCASEAMTPALGDDEKFAFQFRADQLEFSRHATPHTRALEVGLYARLAVGVNRE
jgi:hypothetical protein